MVRICMTGIMLALLGAVAGPAYGDAVDDALAATGIQGADSLDQKTAKALKLLNDQHYFYSKASSLPKSPPFDLEYHLDSLRTPREILSQKIGGGCGSSALAFAAILEKSGVRAENIRIVASVVNGDYGAICRKKPSPRFDNPQTSADGHVFVMIRFADNNWYLINTTELSGSYKKVKVPDPVTLREQMSKGPVPVPREAYQQLLAIPSVKALYEPGMIIFQIWKTSDYPKHTFEDRLNLIASGSVGERRCRYDPDSVRLTGTKAAIEQVLSPPPVLESVRVRLDGWTAMKPMLLFLLS